MQCRPSTRADPGANRPSPKKADSGPNTRGGFKTQLGHMQKEIDDPGHPRGSNTCGSQTQHQDPTPEQTQDPIDPGSDTKRGFWIQHQRRIQDPGGVHIPNVVVSKTQNQRQGEHPIRGGFTEADPGHPSRWGRLETSAQDPTGGHMDLFSKDAVSRFGGLSCFAR